MKKICINLEKLSGAIEGYRNQVAERLGIHPTSLSRKLLSAVDQRPEIRVFSPHSGTSVAEGKDRVYVLAPPPTLLRGTHSERQQRFDCSESHHYKSGERLANECHLRC